MPLASWRIAERSAFELIDAAVELVVAMAVPTTFVSREPLA